jgi:type I restriction enzyme S subunit
MSFPKYSKYKASGVEWLGEVPEHWDVHSLRHGLSELFSGVTSTQVDETEMTVPVTRIETISSGIIDESRLGFINADEAREDRKLRKGDILFSNINSLNMIGNCAVYSGGRVIYAGMNLLVLRPSIQSEPRWLYWLIRSPIFREVVESLAKPAINQASISQASINSIAVPVPEGSEQTAIATFLDRETAKIDGLVAEQRRLMELLKEKRQAVISHVVTKGLNPSAKMKPSGVEWLGDVPEHWEVRRLKHNLQLLTGKTDKRDNPVALENIEGWTGRFISTETEFQGEGVAFDAGDILFGKLRPYLAKAYRAESSGEAVGDFHVLRPVATINSRFAQYQILNREFIAIVDGSTFGSKMPRASWEFVGGMQVTAPPLAEQTAIAAFLDQETARFDTLTAEAQRAIDLLQERRTALISAAVTGQIDVRNMTTKETA